MLIRTYPPPFALPLHSSPAPPPTIHIFSAIGAHDRFLARRSAAYRILQVGGMGSVMLADGCRGRLD